MNESICKHFGACGGCSLQNIKYEDQLKLKQEKIKELFGECSPIIPSPEVYFYRNRMDFAFGPDYTIGLKDSSYKIINIDKCQLMSPESNKILNRLRYFISWKKLANLKHLVVREGKNIKNTIINVITGDKIIFPLEELWEKIQDLANGVTWSINSYPSDRSYGEIQKTFGQDHHMESLNGIKFKIPVQSFFQTNTHQAENMLKIISDFAELSGKEKVLDLYTGTGSIGLSLASKADRIYGVEENKPAVELSKSNAVLNNIQNYSAIAGRVETIMGELCEKYDLVIVDPPRPGVSKRVLLKIADLRPRKIIYVSCNPDTQKHDVEILKKYKYQIDRCQPLDMFPHTPHIENVIRLQVPSGN